METKAKWDFSATTIVGITFCFMGLVYTAISTSLFLAPADSESIVVRSIFLPLGLVFFLSGSLLLARAAAKKHRADQLIADGRYVWATITELREVRTINGFRGHPCVVHASHTDAYGHSYPFQSRHLYRKPSASMIGKSVKVYISSGDYTHYYVDLEPLLKRT